MNIEQIAQTLLTYSTGLWLEQYAIVFVALLLLVWVFIATKIVVQKRYHPSKKMFVLHTGIVFAFLGLTISLFWAQPALIQPATPLFDRISVSTDDPFVLSFDRPISKDTYVEIIPHVSGTWKYYKGPGLLPYKRLVFFPAEELDPDTEYQVIVRNYSMLPKTKRDDLIFVFSIVDTKQDNQDREDKTTQIAHSFAPFVKAAETEKELTTDNTVVDTTNGSFSLDVPLHLQPHSHTCYSTAAKMVLEYRGFDSVDPVGFLSEIGFEDTPRNYVTNTWGDPNKGIVGTFDGSGDGGYGVHWDPVAAALSEYRPVEVKRNWDIVGLLSMVKQGNPVIVWWINGVWPAKETSWNTASGEKVYTANGMHTEVVTGWEGSINNPDYILTNDPWRGKRRYTPKQFANLWRWFDNTAIVVY